MDGRGLVEELFDFSQIEAAGASGQVEGGLGQRLKSAVPEVVVLGAGIEERMVFMPMRS